MPLDSESRQADPHHQRAAWISKQLDVASQVVVRPDNIAPQYSGDSNRFCTLPLDTDSSRTMNHSVIYYGGVDVSFPADDKQDPAAVAVYVILDACAMQVVYQDYEYFSPQVPYIPSFLAFREIEPLQRLVQKQKKQRPDLTPTVILVDGNGVLHPRRAGLACFVGIRTGLPTIGVGKTLFNEGGLSKERVNKTMVDSLQAALVHIQHQSTSSSITAAGDTVLVDRGDPTSTAVVGDERPLSSLVDRGMLVQKLRPFCRGVAIALLVDDPEGGERTQLAYALVGHGGRLRGGKSSKATEGSKNPIYISVGHNVSLQEAVRICALLSLARIPEPIRQADLIGRKLLRRQSRGDIR